MFSSKHNPIRMTLVKYSHETGEKHEVDAAHICASNKHMHANRINTTRGLCVSTDYGVRCRYVQYKLNMFRQNIFHAV